MKPMQLQADVGVLYISRSYEPSRLEGELQFDDFILIDKELNSTKIKFQDQTKIRLERKHQSTSFARQL